MGIIRDIEIQMGVGGCGCNLCLAVTIKDKGRVPTPTFEYILSSLREDVKSVERQGPIS